MANESKPGFHCHKCSDCGYVWEHNDDCSFQPGAHDCPKCGKRETWKYFGNERPRHSEYCAIQQSVVEESVVEKSDRRTYHAPLIDIMLRIIFRS